MFYDPTLMLKSIHFNSNSLAFLLVAPQVIITIVFFIWPAGQALYQSFLIEDEVTIVIQINGKKRGLILAKKDVREKEVLNEAKKIENIKKNLKNKKIIKNIFVKNKIINFITT